MAMVLDDWLEVPYDEEGKEGQVMDTSPTGILVVGDTRCGKSSLIQMVTKVEGIQIGDEKTTESTTRVTEHYDISAQRREELRELLDGRKYVFIDTPGFQDTNGTLDDDIMRKTMESFSKRSDKINDIKIVWCISDSDAQVPALKSQANLIQRLDNSTENTYNIWESVLCVHKIPKDEVELPQCFQDLIQDRQGTIFSNDQTVDNTHAHYMGVVCLDFIDNEKKRKRWQSRREHEENDAVMTKDEYLNSFLRKLKGIESHRIEIKHMRCKRCFQEYPGKYPPLRCHAPFFHVNTFHTRMCHPGKLANNAEKDGKTGGIFGGGLGFLGGGGLGAMAAAGAAAGAEEAAKYGLLFGGFTGAGIGLVGGAAAGGVAGLVWGYFSEYHECCGQKNGAPGCSYSCCSKSKGDRVKLSKKCPLYCFNCNSDPNDPNSRPCAWVGHPICRRRVKHRGEEITMVGNAVRAVTGVVSRYNYRSAFDRRNVNWRTV